ncbi:MADS-box protein FBP24-like [Tasmannia lanceolata]|uniref:MADS-box protein FBP24-like n=1 Tax=Tasmannia lanceolata TaxID=3420 RepID=UPI0040649031
MGRAKLPIKPINRERSRNETFKKRRKGLIKKTYEFATLCGVDVCLICFGPEGNQPFEAETYPKNRDEVGEIINLYRGLSKEDQDRRKLDLPSFLEDKKRKKERELDQRRRQNAELLFPSWDNRLNGLQNQQLRELLSKLDSKLEIVNNRLELIKVQNSMKGKEIEIYSKTNQNHLHYMNMDWNNTELCEFLNHPFPISYKPSDQQYIPLDYSYNSSVFDASRLMGNMSSYGHFTHYNNCPPLPMPPFGMWDNEEITYNNLLHKRGEFCHVRNPHEAMNSLPFFNNMGAFPSASLDPDSYINP